MICQTAIAQTSYKGVSLSGLSLGDYLPVLKQNGYIQVNLESAGIVMGVSTNVQNWNDLMGNNFNWMQYNPTNQPANTFLGTNMLGQAQHCIFFETNAPYLGAGTMRCDNMAPLTSGTDKPFTWIIGVNGQSLGTLTAISFGWSAATNASASRTGFRINGAGNGGQTNSFYNSSNTNQVAPTFALFSGVPTNRWVFQTVTYDGATVRQFSNLSPNMSTAISYGQLATHDIYTLGALVHQTTFTQHTKFGIVCNLYSTNANSGTFITNTLNELNAIYKFY